MNETPILRQLLICEKVIVEEGSNDVSLISCHSVRFSDRFPTHPRQFAVYGLLTNGYGTFTMDLIVTRLDTGNEIFRWVFEMQFPDRLRVADVICEWIDYQFPVAGVYQVVLLGNGELLGMTTLELKRKNT